MKRFLSVMLLPLSLIPFVAGVPAITDAHIDVLGAEQVPIVVFFWNPPTKAWVDKLHAAGSKVWMQVASVAGVRIHTIGIGTDQGTVVQINGFSVATALDSDLLEKVATTTDGTYHQADDAAGLAAISKTIDLRFKIVSQHTEVTGLFSAAAVVLLLAGAVGQRRALNGAHHWAAAAIDERHDHLGGARHVEDDAVDLRACRVDRYEVTRS